MIRVKICSFYLLLALLIIYPYLGSHLLLPGPENGETAEWLYPAIHFSTHEFSQGKIPVWNPYLFCGTPHMAHPESAAFYPPYLMSLALGVEGGILAGIVLHLFLIGMGGYFFARTFESSRMGATVAGAILMLCAPVQLKLGSGQLNVLGVMAYLPYIYAAQARYIRHGHIRYLLISIWLAALAFLAGYPPFLAISVLVGFVWSLVLVSHHSDRAAAKERAIHHVILHLSGAGLLVSFQLMPILEFLSQAVKLDVVTGHRIFFFPVENLLTMLAPGIFGDMADSPYYGRLQFWDTCAYIGIATIFLAFFGFRRLRTRYLLIQSGIVLAVGLIPRLSGMLDIFGWVGLSRGASELVYCSLIFVLPVLANGFDAVGEDDKDDGKGMDVYPVVKLWLVFGGMIAGFIILVRLTDGIPWAILFRMIPSTGLEQHPAIDAGASVLAMQAFNAAAKSMATSWVLAALGLALLGFKSRLPERWRMAGWVAFLCADLLMFGSHHKKMFDPSSLHLPQKILEEISAAAPHQRVLRVDFSNPNAAVLDGLRTPGGWSVLRMKSFDLFIRKFMQSATNTPDLVPNNSYITNRSAVRRVVGRDGRWGVITPSFSSGGLDLFDNFEAFPRQMLVAEPAQSLMDVGHLGYVEKNVHSIRWLEDDAAFKKLETSETAATTLVLLDVYEQNWSASIDGQPADLLAVPPPFQSVSVPPGNHIVEFRYDPRSLRFFGIISALTAVLLAGAGIWIWRRDIQPDPPNSAP